MRHRTITFCPLSKLRQVCGLRSNGRQGKIKEKTWLMSALRQTHSGLSGWQLSTSLSLGPARAPLPAHAGLDCSGSLALFTRLSLGL
ncbi:hypothetical protein DVH24_026923 [Malus domestica]|uniref:Uncharacterized protein n=1 Tax=Malus domestica TaxID=3750 RepID=A0A498IP93_MALDO|nr:hypothetical protein DVH24_026923 [Malus domestica]